jgi:hypothetical protein
VGVVVEGNLTETTCCRQRVFTLASVLMCVPLFLLFDSSDGVSNLLNTVAALFILELDHFFAYGVREQRRTELQYDSAE